MAEKTISEFLSVEYKEFAMYVIEGSTLGGNVIAKQLSKVEILWNNFLNYW